MKKRIFNYLKKHKIKSSIGFILCFWYALFLPKNLFNTTYSTILFSKENQLLGATIAKDEQWRFPPTDTIPLKFKQCLTLYEDEFFEYHWGFNPVSISKAIYSNFKTGKTKRGASTLTQQVIRLSRNKKRTYFEKLIELIWASRLEFSKSKSEILSIYASHAPFGGNVVGLEMASWRYFRTSPEKLSWAESATLAVLPNAPSLIFPGKNKQLLKKKRDFLLLKLKNHQIISDLTYQLSTKESIPLKPLNLPQESIHLLSYLNKKHKGKRIQTSININTQNQVLNIVKKYHQQYRKNNIHNLAVLVLDIASKKVIAYVGNSPTNNQNQKFVDMIQANRSTGSTLKPILYMGMLDDGILLPNMLIPDVPTQIKEYKPQNFNFSFSGAVPAKKAIAKSLNIPAVRMLRTYGLPKFKDNLQYLGLKGINKSVDHYGLTLILGGAESSLWDITNMYANIASTLNHYTHQQSIYYAKEHQSASFLEKSVLNLGEKSLNKNIFDAGSIYLGLEAITELTRPENDQEWKHYNSSHKISWKTGTSFGNKDAWSIGVNKKYAVGVWVGNADGEGIANMTGVNYAAPIMFDVFEHLPNNTWFEKPLDELREIEVCAISGHKTTDLCPKQSNFIPFDTNTTLPCPYHKKVFLTKNERYRVFKNCADTDNMIEKNWFVLPANQAWYYKKLNTNYVDLPPVAKNCLLFNNKVMDFISPNENANFILTKNFDEQINPLVLKVTHQRGNEKLFWYLNNQYIKTTEGIHQIAIIPQKGKHRITVVDQNGNKITRNINIE